MRCPGTARPPHRRLPHRPGEREQPRNTIRAYRGDLTGFAAHHDGAIAGLTAGPVRAFLGEIARQTPRPASASAAFASFCKWAIRRDLLDASPMDRIGEFHARRRTITAGTKL